jgi:TM2 domain-containing membrane protein YozV
MTRDLRKYVKDTNTQLVAGAILLLFIIGIGLIYLIYGAGAAMMGFLCLLGAFVPIGLILLSLAALDWITKRASGE